MYEDRVRSAVKSVRWLLVSLVAGAIAIVGVLVYLLATHPKYLPIVAITMQGIVAVELARRLAVKVLRNRTPSPVVLADWIGDGAFVIGWVAIALLTIGREQGWMHGAFEYAMGCSRWACPSTGGAVSGASYWPSLHGLLPGAGRGSASG